MIPEFDIFALLLFRLAGLLRLALGLALPAAVSRRRRSLAPLIGGLLRILRPAVVHGVAGSIAVRAFYAIAIYVSTLLLNVGKSIDKGTFNMDQFAENFLKFWKIIAILTIIAIAFTIISFILGAISGTLMLQGI